MLFLTPQGSFFLLSSNSTAIRRIVMKHLQHLIQLSMLTQTMSLSTIFSCNTDQPEFYGAKTHYGYRFISIGEKQIAIHLRIIHISYNFSWLTGRSIKHQQLSVTLGRTGWLIEISCFVPPTVQNWQIQLWQEEAADSQIWEAKTFHLVTVLLQTDSFIYRVSAIKI